MDILSVSGTWSLTTAVGQYRTGDKIRTENDEIFLSLCDFGNKLALKAKNLVKIGESFVFISKYYDFMRR